MARRAPSLGDLPRDVLLKIAGGLEVVEDVAALRASCAGARAALDAGGWRELTRLHFGAEVAARDPRHMLQGRRSWSLAQPRPPSSDLEAEMRRFGRLASPLLSGDDMEADADDVSDDDASVFIARGEDHVIFDHGISASYYVTGELEVLWPGRYQLEVTTEASHNNGMEVKVELIEHGGSTLITEQTVVVPSAAGWQVLRASRPFHLRSHSAQAQLPFRLRCTLSGTFDEISFEQMRLRRLRSRAAA